MAPPFAPRSVKEMHRWAVVHGVPIAFARRALVRSCVLAAIASDDLLARALVLRGSGALQLFYGGRRECNDIDLVILNLDRGQPGNEDADFVKQRLNRVLNEQLPMHFGGDDPKLWSEWLATIKIQLSYARWVYDVRRFALTDSPASLCCGKTINVATIEVLVVEKLLGMNQAIQESNEHHREADVFDVAAILSDRLPINISRLSYLLLRQGQQRRNEFDFASFLSKGRDYLKANYDSSLREPLGTRFIPFDEAWTLLLRLLEKIQCE